MTEASETAEVVAKISQKKSQKPVLACFLGANKVAKAVEVLRKGRIPQENSGGTDGQTGKRGQGQDRGGADHGRGKIDS